MRWRQKMWLAVVSCGICGTCLLLMAKRASAEGPSHPEEVLPPMCGDRSDDRPAREVTPKDKTKTVRDDGGRQKLDQAKVPRGAHVLFVETFDDENKGDDKLNYNAFNRWVVEDGTVDLIGVEFALLSGRGLYVDLDGSSHNPGRLITRKALELEPGNYRLTFDLAGSQRDDGPNSVVVALGYVYREVFTLDAKAPRRTIRRDIRLEEGDRLRLSFEQTAAAGQQENRPKTRSPRPSDNMGLLLDNIVLASVDSEEEPDAGRAGEGP